MDTETTHSAGGQTPGRSDVSTPASELAPWTTSDSEWNGAAERHGRRVRDKLAIVSIAVLPAAGMAPAILWKIGGATGIALTALIFAATLSFAVWMHRMQERCRAALPIVRREHGCVCPKCFATVTHQPCPRHGVNAAQQRDLMELWEATVLQQWTRLPSVTARIFSGARPSGRRAMPRPLRPLRWLRETAADDRQPAWKRFVAMGVWCGLFMGVWLLVMRLVVGPMAIGPQCMLIVVMPMVFLAFFRGPARTRDRCAACGQECAVPHPPACPECGASLSAAGAVTSTRTLRPTLLRVLVSSAAVLVAMLLPAVIGMPFVLTHLPTGLLLSSAEVMGPGALLFKELQSRPMSDAEWARAADVMIEGAAPGSGQRVYDFGLFTRGLAGGMLAPEYAERAARATVVATLEARVQGAELRAKVVPQLGENLFMTRTIRIVSGGFSLDGGPLSPSATWSLEPGDLDPIMRSVVGNPIPESKLVFEHAWPAAGLEPGEHTVRARCWIVVAGTRGIPFKPLFDADGNIVPPQGGLVYDLPLETAVRIER